MRGTQAGWVDRGGLEEFGTLRAKAVGLAVGSHSVPQHQFCLTNGTERGH